jgi:hypothetical protein
MDGAAGIAIALGILVNCVQDVTQEGGKESTKSDSAYPPSTETGENWVYMFEEQAPDRGFCCRIPGIDAVNIVGI